MDTCEVMWCIRMMRVAMVRSHVFERAAQINAETNAHT